MFEDSHLEADYEDRFYVEDEAWDEWDEEEDYEDEEWERDNRIFTSLDDDILIASIL